MDRLLALVRLPKIDGKVVGSRCEQRTSVREEQLRKASSPNLLTESGMVTEVREEQFWKAYLPISVTEDGIMTDVREEQP